MISNLILVAVGGALGAVARYLISISPMKSASDTFPLPTFSVNVVGSFLIGTGMIYLARRTGDNEALKLALLSGFLGSFTTFSAFQFEIYELIKDGNHLNAIIYTFASLLLGFIGLLLGMLVGRIL